MKVTELLHEAEKAIAARNKTVDESFSLLVREGIILCLPIKQLRSTDKYVCPLSKSDVVNGLNNEQWDRIFRTLHYELINGKIK